MKELYTPFIIQNIGSCPYCGSYNITLVEKDVDITEIKLDGTLGKSINISTEARVYCSECLKESPFIRKGFHIIPITTKKEKELEIIRDEKEKKIESKLGDNPFSK